MPTPGLNVTSVPYIGFEVECEVTGREPSGSDWIGLYIGSSRVTYSWLKPPKASLKFGLHHLSSLPRVKPGGAAEVQLKLYSNGGWFSDGNLECTKSVILKNPMQKLTCAERENGFQVSYKLSKGLPDGGIKLVTKDGVRLATVAFDRPEGDVLLPLPRAPGDYTIACLASSSADSILDEAKVAVKPSIANAYEIRTSASDSGPFNASAITVRPGVKIFVECSGPVFADRDEVALIADASVSGTPTPKAMQSPVGLAQIEHSGVASIVAPSKEGLYYVTLGLRHSTGASLCGAHGILMVSKKAAVSGGAPASPPPQLLPRTVSHTSEVAGSGATPERFLCVICRDRPLEVLVMPCNHLCLCEGCAGELQQRRHPCPMCRGDIKEGRKVFFP